MTLPLEKLNLNWMDFQKNMAASYHNLRENPDYSDVTLVCEDDQQIEAHRIILTACSPFFDTILQRNKHSHPIVYMRGTKTKDLVAIVDYIYYGKTNIYEEDLEGFLALAEELKLKGLANTGSQDIIVDNDDYKSEKPEQKHHHKEPIWKKEQNFSLKNNQENDTFSETKVSKHNMVQADTAKINVPANISMKDLKVKLDSLMETVNDGVNCWKCNVCGKLTKESTRQNMRTHIETHMEGLSYPCSQCDTICRSNNGFYKHVLRNHRK